MFRIFRFCLLSVVFHQFLQEDCPGTVITNFHQKNCTDRATTDTSYYLNTNGCIPNCAVYPTDDPDFQCTNRPNICLAGYECEKRCGPKRSYREHACQFDNNCTSLIEDKNAKCLDYCVLPKITGVHCMAYHSKLPEFVDTYWKAQKFKPVCDDAGKWVSKQCKGGFHGRCMCYNGTGIRLFGEALYSQSENMTCACSRKKNDLELNRKMVTLHCDSMGNYEALQCDVEKDICWCAESKTGKLTAPVVPGKAKEKLPCYHKSLVGSQYLRQCESKKFAQLQIYNKLKTHGAKYIQTDTLLCDADGSYGAYSVSSGMAYCTSRNNTKIGNWYSNVDSNIKYLNCNCAKDFQKYGHTMSCSSNGNYESVQKYINEQGDVQYYCVDDDGFAKTDLYTQSSTYNCSEVY